MSSEISSQDMNRRLPPELERDIFELTARLHRGTAPMLTLVARRVQLWIEPIIYEVILLSNRFQCGKFLHTIDTRPAQFFSSHVKSLFIPYFFDAQQTARILSKCSGVAHLASWTPIPRTLCESFPSPQHLSINLTNVFHPVGFNFHHPLFQNVTHLWAVDDWVSWISWPDLTALDHLTHLALNFSDIPPVIFSTVADFARLKIEPCKALKVCVLCVHSHERERTQMALEMGGSMSDSRFVVMSHKGSISNWETSLCVDDPHSFWTAASDIVNKRKQAEQ